MTEADLGTDLGRLDMELEDPLTIVRHKYRMGTIEELTDSIPQLGDGITLARTIELEVVSITNKVRDGNEVHEVTWAERI